MARRLLPETRQVLARQLAADETMRDAVVLAAPDTLLAHVRDAALKEWAWHAPRLLCDPRGKLAQWLESLLSGPWTWPAAAKERWPAWVQAAGPETQARVVLRFAWPVADPAVHGSSASANHCIRVPFSMHATRATMALPLRDDDVRDFDPAHAPTVEALARGDPEAVARFQHGIAAMDTWLGLCGYAPVEEELLEPKMWPTDFEPLV